MHNSQLDAKVSHLHEAHVEEHLALKLPKYHCVYSRGPQRRLDLHVEDLNRIRSGCSSASPYKALAQSLNPRTFRKSAMLGKAREISALLLTLSAVLLHQYSCCSCSCATSGSAHENIQTVELWVRTGRM
jgi:hypothetical protein